MKDLSLPLSSDTYRSIANEYGSPIYIYDEAGIRATARRMNAAFSWNTAYKNYFAVKATPTPAILKILHEEGMGFDCSSRTELLMVQHLGISGDDIFYTSNNTPREDFELAIELGATINIDDLAQIPVFVDALAGRRIDRVAVRYNPGGLKSGNSIIGEPTEAKYGMRLDQLADAFAQLPQQDIGQFGVHTMVTSNERGTQYFAHTSRLLLEAIEAIEQTGAHIDFINVGGGFGLNYRPDEKPFDLEAAANDIQNEIVATGRELKLFTENGRFVTGPHGYLLTAVRYVMNKHKTYVGVDASMHNLMRPGMYGTYHHITVLDAESRGNDEYDVVGSLCENNDKFAIDRQLPQVSPGDLLVVHDAGAHGHSMGFNYNGLLRSAEVLVKMDGTADLIRRAETQDDYFQTVVWPEA